MSDLLLQIGGGLGSAGTAVKRFKDMGDGTHAEVGSSVPQATETHLGAVGGHTRQITPTLAVSTSPAYSANDVVGGVLPLTGAMRVSGGTGILQSLLLVDLSNQKAALEILIFNASPAQGTYTDNAAMPSLATNTADAAKLIRRISVAAADWVTVGSVAIADLSPGGRCLAAVGSADLYAVLVTTGTPTFATTGALTLRVGILAD